MQSIGLTRSEPDCDGASVPDDVAQLAELVSDGVVWSEGGVVVRATRRAADLVGDGPDPARLVGRSLAELLTPRGCGPLLRDASELVSCTSRTGRGGRTLHLRTRAVDDERAVHVITDIGDAERARTALVEASRDLARAREQTAEAERELSAALAERQELVNVVCHELRTPITVVRGYAKLLLSEEVGPLTDEQRRFVEESARSCSRLDEFVEMLVRAVHEERVAMDRPVEADAALEPVLEGVLDYLMPVLDERGIRVELELAEDALGARFDAARIEQVLVNLVTNGVDHVGPSRTLRIHTRRIERREPDGTARDWIEVGVSDDGPGVPEADRQRIFEPYCRGASPISKRGLGLGLAICRRIVEAHGGRIAVRDAGDGPRTGSCFAFELPAAAAGTAGPARGQEG